MTIIRKGVYLELVNRSTQRVVFSAATDELDKPAFEAIWKAIGDHIYSGACTDDRVGYYELRVSPIT